MLTLFLCLPLVPASAKSSSPKPEAMYVGPSFRGASMVEYCQYFRDPDRNHTLADVAEGKGAYDWQDPGFSEFSFGFTRGNIFLRCVIENPTDKKQRLFLTNKWPLLDVMELRFKKKDGSYYDNWSGNLLKMDEKPGPRSRGFVLPFGLPGGQTTVLYIRQLAPIANGALLFLFRPEAYYLDATTQSVHEYIVMALLLLIFGMNVLLFITLRDNRFYMYIGFLVAFMLFFCGPHGYLKEMIYGDYTGIDTEIIEAMAGLFTFFLTRFGYDWFKDSLPPERQWVLFPLHGIGGIGLLASLSSPFIDYYPALIAASNAFLVFPFITPMLLYLVFIKRVPQGLIWFNAVTVLFSGLLTWLLMIFGILPARTEIILFFGYSAMGCSIILTLAVPARVHAMKNQLASMNDEMNQMNDQLLSSLDEVNKLNEKQKGDYMLTSHLLRPLQINSTSTEAVGTDFFVRQYKQFEFRNRKSEIGGDLCRTEHIHLGGKQFTFFINGDAMGKSIQGAGGALVLGAAIQAQLSQARLGKVHDKLPELWLRDLWRDIHELFLAFDGSMLMSIVMGLVDETTGVMYFVNSEHPWTVLFREGKASFLEEELTMRKLGMDTGQEHIYVQTAALQPGDVIIAGSDGRDDIMITGPDGEITLNEDEHLFLQWVEEAQGDVQQIGLGISEGSELKDDLSILGITVKDIGATIPLPAQSLKGLSGINIDDLVAAGNWPKLLSALKKLIQKAAEEGDWETEAQARYYVYYLDPLHTGNIQRLMLALFKVGRIGEAADFGELCVLRFPEDTKHMLNLAKLYYKMGINRRVETLTERLLDMDPKNTQAQNLAKVLATGDAKHSTGEAKAITV